MPNLELSFSSGESLSVRSFSVREGVSTLFEVSVVAMSPNASLDLDALVGRAAALRLSAGPIGAAAGDRHWSGVCSFLEQVAAEPTGLSTYALSIVPELWLLTQRRNYRIFQHLSIPDIVDRLLSDWSIRPTWQIDRGEYPKLEYKVQYGESDYAFFSRLLEEAGIAFSFPDGGTSGSTLTLGDALEHGAAHAASPITFADAPNPEAEQPFVTKVHMGHGVRPGAFTMRDHDFRNPAFALFGEAPKATAPEDFLEQYHYRPGAFLVEGGAGGGTPVADDKGVARHDVQAGIARAFGGLRAERAGKRRIAFQTNVVDLAPGAVFSIEGHPHAALAPGRSLLVTELRLDGTSGGEWTTRGTAYFADAGYRPPIVTPKPEVKGVQCAVVVGPPGEEIHTDEFGRVRVQLPWDREGKLDDGSSCWMRVSQGWAGTGFGMLQLPRVGQEVLVGFLAGDPDQPIVVGRVFNATSPVPYKLPDFKTRSTWKSDSSPGGGGFNEILFEDAAGAELVYMQAQKNQRRLVKNDEVITVVHDRQKLVKANETETTLANRTEVTAGDRVEITDGNRRATVGADLSKKVAGNEAEITEGNHALLVRGTQDIVVDGVKKEKLGADSHLHVIGAWNEQVDGDVSITVGMSRQESVGMRHALDVKQEIHIKAGTTVVIEGLDLTLKGGGGFVRIDPGGVTIQGTLVKINSGGAAGAGSGSSPTAPEDAVEAVIEASVKPEPDDVSKTGLGQ